jgi:hypothetical protein
VLAWLRTRSTASTQRSEMTTIITSRLLLVWLLAWSVNAQRNQFATSEVATCGSSGLSVSNFGATFVLSFCSHPHLLSICRYHRFTRQLDYAAVLTAQRDGLSPRSNNHENSTRIGFLTQLFQYQYRCYSVRYTGPHASRQSLQWHGELSLASKCSNQCVTSSMQPNPPRSQRTPLL